MVFDINVPIRKSEALKHNNTKKLTSEASRGMR